VPGTEFEVVPVEVIPGTPAQPESRSRTHDSTATPREVRTTELLSFTRDPMLGALNGLSGKTQTVYHTIAHNSMKNDAEQAFRFKKELSALSFSLSANSLQLRAANASCTG
jgi:hypothetical protein